MDNRKKYEHLASPIRIGRTVLRNRIIAAPITSYAEEPSPADKWESVAAKARGGAGLIVVGSVAVNETNALIYYESGSLFGHEKKILEEQVSMAHQYGAKISVELFHGGMFADCRGTGAEPWGPDECERSFQEVGGYERIEPDVQDVTHVHGMTIDDMHQVCREFAASAVEARRMGFDMVMLHFAHGWLPAQFMSPFFNHRIDEFGGSFENRTRFPRMIVETVRKAVGPGFPIDIRIGANEYVEGGLEVKEVADFIESIQDQIDMVHVSSGLDKLVHATSYIEAPSVMPHQINVKYAETVKKQVKIPVAVVGRITTPEEAEKILSEGKADLIALGRPFIADPDWAWKACTGHGEDIRTCIRCVSCYGVATGGCSQGCAVNPRYERELRLRTEEILMEESRKIGRLLYDSNGQRKGEEILTKGRGEGAAAEIVSGARRRMVIIGGGPAGMTAAIGAAEQGYQVILLEREDRLGGLLKISETDPCKVDMRNYLTYLRTKVSKLPIEVRLNTAATPELTESLHPDRIIVALGSYPRTLPIPGADQKHVHDIVQAHQVNMGDRVAIIGGGASGCELALALLGEGKEVTILEMTDRLAGAGNLLYRAALGEQLAKYPKFHVVYHAGVRKITSDGVLYCLTEERADGGQILRVPADDVVLCVGLIPRSEEAMQFLSLGYDVRMVGDCVAPRRINEAVQEGYFAGRYMM